MRFLHAHIYGFGKWLHKKITLHEHGITCIVGENESGKSTFQAFISFVLFGLPPKEREVYRPKTSGTLGGELLVLLETGETVTIKRVDGQQHADATCILSSGEQKDEQWLKQLLQGMTADLFSATYQFTTKDLYAFEHVQLDELSKVLLNTSVAGASLLHEVEKKFAKQKDELFKPRASVLAINKQLTLLENLQKQLQEHAHMTVEYRDLTEKIATYKEELHSIQEKLKIAKKNRITWEQVETALPFIQQYERAKEYLQACKPTSIHVEDIERLETMQQEESEITSQMSFIQRNIDRYTEEINRFPTHPTEIIREGKLILQEKDKWAYYEQMIEELDREKDQINHQIETKMAPYTQVASLEDLTTIELPPFIDKKWRTIAREAEGLEETRQQRKNMVAEALRTIQGIDEQIAHAQHSMLTEEEYDNYKGALHVDNQVKSRQMYEQTFINQAQQQKSTFLARYQQGKKLLAGFIGLAIICVLAGWFSSIPWFYHGAILSVVIGWMQWSFKRKDYKNATQKSPHTIEAEDKTLDESERTYFQEKIDSHNQSKEAILFFRQRKEEFQRLYTKRKNEFKQVIQTEEKMNKQIEDELYTYPFLGEIELPYWEEIGVVLREVHSLYVQKESVANQLAELKIVRKNLEQKIRTFSHHLSVDNSLITVPLLFARVEEFIHEDVKNRERLEHISHEKREALEHYHLQLERNDAIANEIKTIYLRAQVSTKEEFLQEREKFIKQQEKLKQMNQAKEQLIAIFSSNTWDTYVHQDIHDHTVQYEQSTWTEQIASLEKELENIRDSLATSQASLEHLERKDSRSYSEQMHTFEREQEVLQQLAEEWATYEIAYSTLKQTKKTFMRKHVVSLFEKASEHFAYITNNRYNVIHTDVDKGEITVMNDANISFSPTELSKGTRDQLYIAIRLSMGQHTQERMPFPFVFDDSFVHFDGERTKRMIQLMLRVSKEQQVIVFTCKDEIEEIIQHHTKENEVSWVRIQ